MYSFSHQLSLLAPGNEMAPWKQASKYINNTLFTVSFLFNGFRFLIHPAEWRHRATDHQGNLPLGVKKRWKCLQFPRRRNVSRETFAQDFWHQSDWLASYSYRSVALLQRNYFHSRKESSSHYERKLIVIYHSWMWSWVSFSYLTLHFSLLLLLLLCSLRGSKIKTTCKTEQIFNSKWKTNISVVTGYQYSQVFWKLLYSQYATFSQGGDVSCGETNTFTGLSTPVTNTISAACRIFSYSFFIVHVLSLHTLLKTFHFSLSLSCLCHNMFTYAAHIRSFTGQSKVISLRPDKPSLSPFPRMS